MAPKLPKNAITSNNERLTYGCLSLLWFLLALWVLFQPANQVSRIGVNLPHLDKLVHFLLFFVQVSLLRRALKPDLNTTAALFLISAIISWAGVSEYIQHALTTRSGDFFDALADSVGGLCALWAFSPRSIFGRIWRKKTL